MNSADMIWNLGLTTMLFFTLIPSRLYVGNDYSVVYIVYCLPQIVVYGV